MIALAELKKLPIAERLQLVEDLWESMEDERRSLPDLPELIEDIRARSADLKADPSSGISWDELEKRIRTRRG